VPVGGDSDDLELSQTRAEAVAKKLKQRGISAEMVTGWGSARPIASNDTPSGRWRNRRVEIWVR
jgi:outer membrane protein OmpA-like peptidoglycan-associated protein